MKKLISMVTLIAMVCAMCVGTPAYAAEIDNETAVPLSAVAMEDGVAPCGTLSGYGQIWHEPSTMGTSGQFDIVVTGASWLNAHATITFENFSADTKISLWFWGPTTNSSGERQLLYKTSEPESITTWSFQDQMFNPGSIGTYTIQYQITGTNSAGRINCWIF